MKSIIESFAKEEQAILIVALFLLIYVGIMINVMVREYRTYLDDYPMYHFSLGDFIRRGRFYSAWVEDKQKVTDINEKLGNGTIKHIVFDKSFSTYTPTSLYCFFEDLKKLETITGLEYLNTEKVTDMYSMFYNCSSLTSLDVTHFNTANVTNMSFMFASCGALTTIYVSDKFVTDKVTKGSNM